ncbi:NAD-dependent epimerase/dehydratase [Natronococcus amylolyticus DSM 10524]|uniref:NAD-dependent epimerase/dehydratase n=1 Tax=Natronococcus amylolyticus DSM 10524 TaxID=1227497 RepID=L9XFA3_9EURY|nr:NAD(P)-dependent oxidoreductase [Natronococcus amylolyticus]ELY60302.1 NAD-dependent epimerase/dehydratase [Natronococcus amylolyticus DSM 10524]
MKLVVTGATGGIGSWVVESLASAGHEVLGVDLERPSGERENATFLAGDLTEQGVARELIRDPDPDAVVHCAGVPAMGIRAGGETFETNVVSTYHALEAAGLAGAEVVWTSSESTYGMPFAATPSLPDYLPIDEDHPQRPEDPYGTSKLVGEVIAERAVRAFDVPVTSLRPAWVSYPGSQQLARVREAFDPETVEPGDQGSGNFWSYVDVRDLVSLVEAALATDVEGHEAYLAVAAENYLGRPTAETIEDVYGDLPTDCTLEGEESAFATAKAREELGWEPEHTWRETEAEEAVEPSFLDG